MYIYVCMYITYILYYILLLHIIHIIDIMIYMYIYTYILKKQLLFYVKLFENQNQVLSSD